MRLVTEIPSHPQKIICEMHGEYEEKYIQKPFSDKFMVMSECPKCTVLENQKRDAEQERRIAELKEKKFQQQLTLYGLGKRHISARFENFRIDTQEQKQNLELVKNYLRGVLAGKGTCLMMTGTVGTGKTHLASSMAYVMATKKLDCKLIKMSELIRKIKSTWSRNSEKSESSLINYFSELPLLIIDEIGVQFGSDTEKLLISEIIDNRYQRVLPTVLISNLDADGIRRCIGDRSYDRLKEDDGVVIAFNWESYRGKAVQQTPKLNVVG